MPMFPLVGSNHHLPLLHMDERFIFLEEIGERINDFKIGYMINPCLYVGKDFIDQVEKCINTTFGSITQPLLKPHNNNKYKGVSIINVSLDKRMKA